MEFSSTLRSGLVASVMATPAGMVVLSLLSVLVALRMWRGVNARDNEPPRLPYWIPWLGSAIYVSRDLNGIIESAKKLFGPRIFTVTAAGLRIHITNHPPDVADIFRNPKTFLFHPLVTQGMQNIYSFLPETLEKMAKPIHGTPESSLFGNSHDFYQRHLMPGKSFDFLMERFIKELTLLLDGSALNLTSGDKVIDAEKGILEVLLFHWTRNAIGVTATNTVMGPRLLKENPDFLDKFWEFDNDVVKLMYKYPKFLTKRAVASRDFCAKVLTKIMAEEENFRDEQADMIWRRTEHFQEAGLNDEESALCTLTIIWGLQTNTGKVGFWTLVHIAAYPGLADRIRQETSGAYSTGTLNATYIQNSSPLLTSVFHEVLRLVTTSVTARVAGSDANISGYSLREGDLLLAPIWPLQRSKEIWGEDANVFDPERYLRDPEKFRSPVFRPFGGGVTLCPGRALAKMEVCLFVADVLRRWDVEVLEKGSGLEKVPRGCHSFPGVKDLEAGRDVRVRLTPRAG
ncbi:hypothetical protein RUND412_004548 [Rhizina undulata]